MLFIDNYPKLYSNIVGSFFIQATDTLALPLIIHMYIQVTYMQIKAAINPWPAMVLQDPTQTSTRTDLDLPAATHQRTCTIALLLSKPVSIF